ncbi:MAG: patatin-like phospholipase family protein [Burkholderiales bacterium]|jgi:NTE family protein
MSLHRALLHASLIISLCLSLAVAPPSVAQSASATQNTQSSRPKIALVLSGGGARGAAHVGVIKVLEEMRVPIDLIVGTSMGALIGASYASGTSVAELEQRLSKAEWNEILKDASPREDRSFLRKEEDQAKLLKLELGVKDGTVRLPPGAISGQRLDSLFRDITRHSPPIIDFDKLPIPFRAVATDAETGKMVVFRDGRLTDAMRASMAVPGAVAPFEINNQLFLDGGLIRNLPVDVARALGADVVIAVNIGSGLLGRRELQSILGVSLQMINILTEQNVRESLLSLKSSDVLIAPDMGTIGSGDFERVAEAIRIGEARARALAHQLTALQLPPIDWQQRQLALRAQASGGVPIGAVIARVEIDGLERASVDEVRRTLDIKPGSRADPKVIDAGVSRVFGTGYFERVNYSLLSEGDLTVLRVNAHEKPWGPNYLRFGLSMAADSIGEGRFNLLVRSQMTQVNAAGAEWRNDLQIGRDRRLATRFLQPFWAGSFVNSSVGAELGRRPFDIFVDGNRLAQYDVRNKVGSLDLGADMGRNAIARIGMYRGDATATMAIGFTDTPSYKVRQGGMRFRAVYDSMDDINFPRQGRTFSVDYTASLKPFGADDVYRKTEVNFVENFSVGRHTLSLAGRYGDSKGGELPVFDQFSMGGFLQLSGYRPGELLSERVVFARSTYLYKLPFGQSPLGSRLFAGASAEWGRLNNVLEPFSTSRDRSSLGIFLGADTALGPIYLGYGRTRERSTIFYFFLGQP